MPTNVSFNGSTYAVPSTSDDNWGSSVSSYLIAIASGSLQKTGGNFTLTGDVDFGPSYGLKSAYYSTRSVKPANTGLHRLANDETIVWRNAGNTGNLILKANSSNKLSYSDALATAAISATELSYLAGTTSDIQTQFNGVQTQISAIEADVAANQLDVITTRGDVIIGNSSGEASRIGVGTVGQILTSDGVDVSWQSPAGTGDVSAASNFGTDNILIRSNGTAKGVQSTGITLTDGNRYLSSAMSDTRDGSWQAGIELQTSGASNYPSMFFAGQDTNKYSAIVWTKGTSGDNGNSITGQVACIPTSSTTARLDFSINGNIGTTGVSAALQLESDGISNTANFKSGLKFDSGSTLNVYETTTVTLDNEFTGGDRTLTLTRIGNVVHMTLNGTATHASNISPASSDGIVPADYRPSDTIYHSYYITGLQSAMVEITASGRVQCFYDAANTSTISPIVASYVIT